MKKIRILSLLLMAVMVVFVGCGELSDNLKVSNFNVGSADLIFRYLDDYQMTKYYGEANLKSQSQDAGTSFENYINMVGGSMQDVLAISVAMDFYENSSDDEIIKIYEHYNNKKMANNGVYSKYIIYISKGTKQTDKNKLKTTIYLLSATNLNELTSRDYSYVLEHEAELSNEGYVLSYDFTISKDKITNKYTVGYKKNNKSYSYEYYCDRDRGYMTISTKTAGNGIFTSLFLGGYKNNTNICRTIVSYSSDASGVGHSQEYVWEYFDNIYKIKSKVGLALDSSKYVDLKSVLEEDVATANTGDNFGYIVSITYDNLKNNTPQISTSQYVGKIED